MPRANLKTSTWPSAGHPASRRSASALAVVALTTGAAWGQSGPPPAAADAATESANAVVVTGTSIRGLAPVGSATVSIGLKDIQATGKTSSVDIIRAMPQIQNIGADETRTAGRDGAADNSGKGAAINLRGLGNNATLMLVDGHRIAPNGTASAFGDPNQIPAIALQRIEVVTDGASAVYGSDAVAGVVNLILRKNYDGVLTSLAGTTNGDYHQTQFGLLAGKEWDKGGIVVSYQYQDRSAMLQGSSPFMRADLRPFGGPDGRLNGTTTTPGPTAGNIVAGAGAAARLYGVPSITSGVPTLAQITANANALNLVDTSDYVDFLPNMRRHSATLYAEQDLGGGLKVFAEGFYNQRDSAARGYPTVNLTVKPKTPFFVAGVPGASAVTGYTVQYPVYAAFGPTVNTYPERSRALTIGGDARLAGDWKASAYATYSSTSLCNCTPLVNTTVLQALVDTGQFNPYTTGPQADAILSQFRATARQAVTTQLSDFGVKVDGSVVNLPGGAVRAAAGFEHIRSYQSLIRIGADRTTDPVVPIGTPAPGVAFTSVPRQSFFASRDTESSRNIDAVYAELFVPLIGARNASPLAQRLDLSLALRHDRYSDVGTTTNPKLGLTWAPDKSLNVRGSYGSSFRAPSLPESNPFVQGGVRSFAFANASGDPTIPLTNTTNGTTNGIALDGGNTALKPEKATTWSLGADFKPAAAPGLKLSGTFYKVNYKDRIESLSGIFSTFLATPQNRALFAPFIVAAPQPAGCVEGQPSTYNPIYLPYLANPSFVLSTIAQCSYKVIFNAQNANLGDLQQSGVDVSADYQFRTALGDWQVGAALTKILKLKRQLSPVSGMVDVLDTIQFPVSMRLRSALGWQRAGWTVNLFANTTGGYTNNAPITLAGVVQPVSKVPSWTTFDISVGYETGKSAVHSMLDNLRISLSAQNVTDKSPPLVLSSASTFAFDGQNANPYGRVLSLSVAKEF